MQFLCGWWWLGVSGGIDGIGADKGFGEGQAATMIPAPSSARVWLAADLEALA